MPVLAGWMTRDVNGFQTALLAWYRQNRRDLPWRRTRDPYAIWLSEIMLQQTRVAAVIDPYRQFLKRFPTVQKLAAARETSVLAQWSGLGYYRRARNLHAAAGVVSREHAGEFPRTSWELRNLPGIGRYTAAAIASIAFGEPTAVVDGNVERVLMRVSGTKLSREGVWKLANQVLSHDHPGDFNQAMMELGATVCLPGEPGCPVCPVRNFCRTQGRHRVLSKTPRQLKREIAYALQSNDHSVRLVQRPATQQLMPGMWELPQVPAAGAGDILFSLSHSITVTDYKVRVCGNVGRVPGKWIRNSRLLALPLTGLTKKILRRAGIIEIERSEMRPQ